MSAIYKDAHRPVHERVADLLSQMTPEEKFAQMHAFWLILSAAGDHRERTDLSDEFAGVTQQAALSERLKPGSGRLPGRWERILSNPKKAFVPLIVCKKP